MPRLVCLYRKRMGGSCRDAGARRFASGAGHEAGTTIGTPLNYLNVPMSQHEIETTQGFSYNRGTAGTPSLGHLGLAKFVQCQGA